MYMTIRYVRVCLYIYMYIYVWSLLSMNVGTPKTYPSIMETSVKERGDLRSPIGKYSKLLHYVTLKCLNISMPALNSWPHLIHDSRGSHGFALRV